MYKLIVFVPLDHAETVKAALFEAGAGKLGNYDCCSFEVEGVGQFRPLSGARPFIGQTDQLESVRELRVEMLCAEEFLNKALKALKDSHPYETPAYDVLKLYFPE